VYAQVSIAFEVASVLEVDVREGGLGGMVLTERPFPSPYRKDYDAIPGNHPTDWPQQFDMRHWGMMTARENGRLLGGAIIAQQTPELHLLEGRHDLAALWDLRVAPEARGQGVGTALFAAAAKWATARGCRQLKIETQNINVPACKFYARQGCTIGTIHRFAYPDLPHEVQLIWYKTV
jgi:ribosomal protein S18 acetylase RimI-like enzyme